MRLLLPPEIVSQLALALKKAGRREIGGVLMGEHLGPDLFIVKEVTVQYKGGSFAAFLRRASEILGPLRAFFEKTGNDFTRFNYLGEWHSHHSFALIPSTKDHKSMLGIIMDREFGAHFVILLLVAMNGNGALLTDLTVYQPSRVPYKGTVDQTS